MNIIINVINLKKKQLNVNKYVYIRINFKNTL